MEITQWASDRSKPIGLGHFCRRVRMKNTTAILLLAAAFIGLAIAQYPYPYYPYAPQSGGFGSGGRKFQI
ncbi:hypothetical protein DPMN_145702 [Dreissena polymorpha]|uniref:Uncharacterized protein n=1 Tax=Dreissena polymorpha TaxID=45954 RepID=A0A9D4F6K5_DREPO|nr:hypothetical protein DPMN_145702 [Dreissena polymorpha]